MNFINHYECDNCGWWNFFPVANVKTCRWCYKSPPSTHFTSRSMRSFDFEKLQGRWLLVQMTPIREKFYEEKKQEFQLELL